jgi:hypothetical protein
MSSRRVGPPHAASVQAAEIVPRGLLYCAMLRAALLALALTACAHHSEVLRDPSKVVAVGAPAPDGQLATPGGTKVALAEAWRGHKGAVVVFYRGFY